MLFCTRGLLRVLVVLLLCVMGRQAFADEIHDAAEVNRSGVTLSVIAGQMIAGGGGISAFASPYPTGAGYLGGNDG